MAQPPHTGGKKGIVPGFCTAGITRRIEVHDPEPCMQGNVGWKLKVGAYRLKIGCSTCKSSPQAAFDEWDHPPLNPLECAPRSWPITLVPSSTSFATTILPGPQHNTDSTTAASAVDHRRSRTPTAAQHLPAARQCVRMCIGSLSIRDSIARTM